MKCVKQAFNNLVYYFKEENGSKWKIIFKTLEETCPHLNISPFNLCWKLSSLRQCAETSKTEGESAQALLFQMDSCLCRMLGTANLMFFLIICSSFGDGKAGTLPIKVTTQSVMY